MPRFVLMLLALPCFTSICHAGFAESRTSSETVIEKFVKSASKKQINSSRTESLDPAPYGHSEWNRYGAHAERLAQIAGASAQERRTFSQQEKQAASKSLREYNREIDKRFFGTEVQRQMHLLEQRNFPR